MSVEDKAPRKRIEFRDKNIRVSRTGGVAATKTVSKDGYSATINTNHGVRLHKRLFKGARMGFQNGNFQFIGRYHSGPLNFNISKNGVSTSVKNKRGAYNVLKPNYSSFKLGGVQVRGKNAAILQISYIIFILTLNFVKFMWYATISILWFVFLIVKWFVDFIIGFYKGFKNKDPNTSSTNSQPQSSH
ncbi:hypothetical protein K8354_06045 [Polaribacter litorisediminis]|uniref:hypothetical protein n=1 Tax=Polaribacter litorisediminis TaxID=1908341 RepID=UPI001CBB8319|nr:hypothetical protein [Polaribacter litorisediminis]UAM99372.1 hypothetical protein K8354_06045 [Polaribacter litorisediminis]